MWCSTTTKLTLDLPVKETIFALSLDSLDLHFTYEYVITITVLRLYDCCTRIYAKIAPWPLTPCVLIIYRECERVRKSLRRVRTFISMCIGTLVSSLSVYLKSKLQLTTVRKSLTKSHKKKKNQIRESLERSDQIRSSKTTTTNTTNTIKMILSLLNFVFWQKVSCTSFWILS